MEQDPQQSEHEQAHTKHILSFDAFGETGNVFSIIGRAQALLEGEAHEAFMEAVNAATVPGACKKYEDILSLVNEHVRLVDTSGHYPQYGFLDTQEAIDGTDATE